MTVSEILKLISFFFLISDLSKCDHTFAIAFDIRHSSWQYGFSSSGDWLNVAAKIWPSVGNYNISHNVPASLLLNPDKSFHSFGLEAKQQYDFSIEKGGEEYYYFFPQVSKLFESEKVSTICKY